MTKRIRPNDTFSPIEFRKGHQYALELRQLPLADQFGIVDTFGIKIAHNFWVLRDKTLGQDIAQIHGFPFNEQTGERKEFAIIDGAYPLKFFQLPGEAYFDRKDIPTIHEIPLTAEEAGMAWHDTVTGLKHLNDQNIGYRADGYDPVRGYANSNVTAYTMGRLLGRTPAQLKEIGKNAPFSAPGWGEWNLLNDFPDAPAPDGAREKDVLPRTIHPRPGDGSMAPGDTDQDAQNTAHLISGGAGDGVLIGNSGDDDVRAKADRLIGSEDYWRNADKQARTRALFQEIERRERGDQDALASKDVQNLPYFPGAEDQNSRRDTLDRGEPVEAVPLRFDVPADASEDEDLRAEARELMAADDYWRDPHKQRRVAAIFRRLYPGTLRTAPLDFGEGA